MNALLRLLPYFRRYRGTMIMGILSILISVVFMTFVPVLIRDAVDSLSTDMRQETIIRYALLVVAVSAVSGVFLYLQRQTIIVASRRIEYDLRNDFFTHVQSLSLRYFQTTPTGDIMAHSTNDIGAVRMFVGPAIMYSAETLFTFVIVLTAMLRIDPALTLLALLPLPLVSYAVHRVGAVIHKRFEDIQRQFSTLTATAQESLSGIRVVKSYQREEYETGRFHELSVQYRDRNMRMARIQALFMPLLMMLIGLSVIVAVWFGGLQVIDGRLSLGELTQFIMYVSMLIWPMIAVGWVASIIQRAAASMKRISAILDVQPEITDREHAVTPTREWQEPAAGSDRRVPAGKAESMLRGDISFTDVRFSYGPELPAVLDGVSLEIERGTTLAIVGRTGTGKSSLVNLIPRLYDVTGGAVRIDGRDVRELPLALLRRSVSFVTQETFLFSDTLRANIQYAVDEPDEAAMLEAAAIARIDKDVEDFPNGYDTILGERGITLSGGQKQRVSIARAVLRNPSILILDDALSAVDTHTEEEILSRLRTVMRERTSIIISHRISTVKDADCIVVLRDGRIAERGTHDELVALGGEYAELHEKQLLARELEELE